MKLGIMQPYFFPYLGYFDLINYSDKWIVFDKVQYIRHGWINRNRILHPTQGWQYVIVPVKKHSRGTAIKDIKIADRRDWRKRILGQLQHYEGSAPYFLGTMEFVEYCLASKETSISRLNTSILDKACAYLGINFHYRFFSGMDLELGPVEGPGDWALRISEALGAEEYVNPPGGMKMFDDRKFVKSDITLTFRQLPPLEYRCGKYEFVPSLSIIDLLMWNEPAAIKLHLDRHK